MSDDFFDADYSEDDVELEDNLVSPGDDLNLMEKDPTLRKILIGVGWDVNAFDADVLDLDISVFLLDKDGKTRVDEDFIFYNNLETLDGAIKHNGDSRTGAGDGDDETISIDLHGIPFDVTNIAFVLSIYKGEEKGQDMGAVKGAYLRIANEETEMEIARYVLEEELIGKKETGLIVASINREGPKWHFTPLADFVQGGLSQIATDYGMIIINQ